MAKEMTPTHKRRHPLSCLDCGRRVPTLFMLKNDVWLSIAKANDLLCMECTEKRLGRPVRRDEFTDVPTNYIFGYLPLDKADSKTQAATLSWWCAVLEKQPKHARIVEAMRTRMDMLLDS